MDDNQDGVKEGFNNAYDEYTPEELIYAYGKLKELAESAETPAGQIKAEEYARLIKIQENKIKEEQIK